MLECSDGAKVMTVELAGSDASEGVNWRLRVPLDWVGSGEVGRAGWQYGLMDWAGLRWLPA